MEYLQESATFGQNFLPTYAARLITDPRIAITELVANAWDAGAMRVVVSWPQNGLGQFSIEDNGLGMTHEQCWLRWRELSYNRQQSQGDMVEFPDINGGRRKPYGRNGKGRQLMFCFSDTYLLETWRDGEVNVYEIARSYGNTPYEMKRISTSVREGHGTRLSTLVRKNPILEAKVRSVLESRFVSDPSFRIEVNDLELSLTIDQGEKRTITTKYGDVQVILIDSSVSSSRSDFHGIAWWVNHRLVGDPSWIGIDGSALVDRRTLAGRRYTFIVEADILEDHIEYDWSGFLPSDIANTVRSQVEDAVRTLALELTREDRQAIKRDAVSRQRDALRALPVVTRQDIGWFIDELQLRTSSIGADVLATCIDLLAKLESSRSGFSLLNLLAMMPIIDLDELETLLAERSVAEIRVIVRELSWRIDLIKKLEEVVNVHSDELHDIHPLFNRGLWIFGPEFEGVDFISNRALSTVLSEFLGDKVAVATTPRRRPDLVVVPDSSLELYSQDAYGQNGDPNGLRKIVIIELKRGGFEITKDDLRQADDYAEELRRSGRVNETTEIVCWVLGTRVAPNLGDTTSSRHIQVYGRRYDHILSLANARTFQLKSRIEQSIAERLEDPIIEEVVASTMDLYQNASRA